MIYIDFDDITMYALSVVHDEPIDYNDTCAVDTSSCLVDMENMKSLHKNHIYDLVSSFW